MAEILGTPRSRIVAACVFVAIAATFVSWMSWQAIATMRPLHGSGVVLGKHDGPGSAVIVDFVGGGELPVVAIASRIDAGDRVEKKAGELAYTINGRRVNPLGTVIGALIFFWIFLPILAFLPVLILVKTKEDVA